MRPPRDVASTPKTRWALLGLLLGAVALAFLAWPVLPDLPGLAGGRSTAARADTLSGRVVGRDGEPVPGARVVAVHRPFADRFESPAERHETKADGRGLFHLEVTSEGPFSVWARWGDGATRIAEGVCADDVVELVEDLAAHPQVVEVIGDDTWAERGPLAFRVPAGSENLDLIAVEQVDGRLFIPCLPAMHERTIEVVGSDGELMWHDIPVLAGDGREVLELPPLADVEVRVLGSGGQPLAGAEIRRQLQGYRFAQRSPLEASDDRRVAWPIVGVTGEQGELTLRLPMPEPEFPVRLLAQRGGHQASISGRSWDECYRNGKAIPRSKVVTFDLQTAEPVRGRITTAEKAYQGTVAVTWTLPTATSGAIYPGPPRDVVDGELECPRPPEGAEIRSASATLPPTFRRAVRARLDATPPAATEVRLDLVLTAPQSRVELPLESSYFCVRATSAEGLPAPDAKVMAAPIYDGRRPSVSWQGVMFAHTDRRGQAALSAGTGDVWLLAATERAWASRRVSPADRTATLDLALEPRPVVEGRVRDDDGAPAVGALVEVRYVRVEDGESSDRVVPTAVARTLLLRLEPVAADADGRFRLPLLPANVSVGLQAYWPDEWPRDDEPHWVRCTDAAGLAEVALRVARQR